MIRKKIGFMNVNNRSILNRQEMSSILAGSGCSGNECTNCVICYGSSTEEPDHVYYGFNGEDPSQVCRREGPYSSGTWGQCY